MYLMIRYDAIYTYKNIDYMHKNREKGSHMIQSVLFRASNF